MKVKNVLLTIGATLALTAGSAMAADVSALWDKHCLKCHGKDGKGGTRMGRQAGVKDYTDPKVQAEMKDETAIKTIKEGLTEKGKERMKAYGAELSDDDVKGLVAHMRTFKK